MKQIHVAGSIIIGLLICLFVSCQKEPEIIAVTSITLSQTAVEITEGESTHISATISPSNATNKKVIWSSDNPFVTVSDGTITGAKPCSATVTAKSDDGGKTASCLVRVLARFIHVSSVSLDITSLTMTEGDTQALIATISPSDATDKTVTWSSDNESVASVSSSGVVSAKAPGKAMITVNSNDGGKVATCSVMVKAKIIAVTGVSLDETSLTMTEGDTHSLAATVTPSNATYKSITWSSSAPSVAEVSSSGIVIARSEGSATITVRTTDGGKTASCFVVVNKKVIPVESIKFNKYEMTLIKGQSETLIATVYPSDATDKTVRWFSSNLSVATVDQNGKVTAIAGGSADIVANAGGRQQLCMVTVIVPVESVSLDRTSIGLTEGESINLVATVNPDDATDKKVTWSSSNTSVATVDQNGRVTANATGSATITVKTNDGGKTATCAVTVKAKVISVTGVSLNTTSLTITEGDTQVLTATVSPSNATDKTVTWSSNNTSVATVSSSGVVTAKSPGTATITVKTNDGGKTATCTVTVKAKVISVTGVSLNTTSLTITEGDTQALTATVSPSNATDKSVMWSSSNTSLATVSSSGVVTAKSPGTATITVKTNDGGKTATCTVTVKAKVIPVTGISLNTSSITMKVGETQTLSATVTPSNATDKTVTWKSTNTSVATVDSNGKVTAKSAGSATISATAGSFTANCSVTVVVPVVSVSLNKTELTLEKGKNATLTATINPSNATDKTVTWKSSNTAIATVDQNGKVTAAEVGSAVITVTTNDGSKTATCSVTVKKPGNTETIIDDGNEHGWD